MPKNPSIFPLLHVIPPDTNPLTTHRMPTIYLTCVVIIISPDNTDVPLQAGTLSQLENIIKPDEEENIEYFYPLRSTCQINNTTPANVAYMVIKISQLANVVVDKRSGNLLKHRRLVKGPYRDILIKSCANDLGRLLQGIGTCIPTGTTTVFLVPFNKVPKYRKVAYIMSW